MNSTKPSRIYAYDNLKFILILFVVLGHHITAYTEQCAAFKSLYVFIYSFHMPAFVFISGLFFKKALSDASYVRNKICFFLSLYVLMKIPQYLVLLLFDKTGFHLLSENSVPWYMMVMAECLLVTYLTRNMNRRFLFILSIVLACFAGYDPSLGDFLCLSRLIAFYPFFLAGTFCDPQKLLKAVEKPVMRIGGGGILILLALMAVFRTVYISGMLPIITGRHPYSDLVEPFGRYGGILRLAYYIAAFVLIISWISVIPRRKCLFSDMGKRTIQPFALHRPLLYLLQYVNIYEILGSSLPAPVWQIVYLAIGVLLCLLLSIRPLERPFKALERLCTGIR